MNHWYVVKMIWDVYLSILFILLIVLSHLIDMMFVDCVENQGEKPSAYMILY